MAKNLQALWRATTITRSLETEEIYVWDTYFLIAAGSYNAKVMASKNLDFTARYLSNILSKKVVVEIHLRMEAPPRELPASVTPLPCFIKSFKYSRPSWRSA